jgi:hypothetical protein
VNTTKRDSFKLNGRSFVQVTWCDEYLFLGLTSSAGQVPNESTFYDKLSMQNLISWSVILFCHYILSVFTIKFPWPYLCFTQSTILVLMPWKGLNVLCCYILEVQSDFLARGPKLLSIKHYVIEIMPWIYIHIPGTMQNRTCSSMLKMVSFHIQAHLNAFIDNSLGPLVRESPCIKFMVNCDKLICTTENLTV